MIGVVAATGDLVAVIDRPRQQGIHLIPLRLAGEATLDQGAAAHGQGAAGQVGGLQRTSGVRLEAVDRTAEAIGFQSIAGDAGEVVAVAAREGVEGGVLGLKHWRVGLD